MIDIKESNESDSDLLMYDILRNDLIKVNKILVIRIDISCPPIETYLEQNYKKQSLKRIRFDTDRSINKYKNENNKKKFNETFSIDTNSPKDFSHNSLTSDSLENEMNLINIERSTFNKTFYNLFESQNITKFELHDINFPKKIDLFKLKRNSNYESYLTKKMKGNGSAAVEVVKYEHEFFYFSQIKAFEKKIENSKLSMSMFRDCDSINTKNQNLNYTKAGNLKRTRCLFDLKAIDYFNRKKNDINFIVFNKNFYTKICQLDTDLLFKSSEIDNRPKSFETSLGDFRNKFGSDLPGNIQYEHLYEYLPVYFDLNEQLNKNLTNDEILNLINSKLEEKLKELEQLSVASMNLKFPIDFVLLNSGKIKFSELKQNPPVPEFYLISYQVLDRKFQPLNINQIKCVKVNYTALNEINQNSIRAAIEKCIGQNIKDMYKCNLFKIWNYVVLIKKPIYSLNNVVYNKKIMENFNLMFDPNFCGNNENLRKITNINFEQNNSELIRNQVKCNNHLLELISTKTQRENGHFKTTQINQKITRKRFEISSNGIKNIYGFTSVEENKFSGLNKNNNNQDNNKSELLSTKITKNKSKKSKISTKFEALKAKYENLRF